MKHGKIIWVGKPEGKINLRDIRVNGRILFNRIRKKQHIICRLDIWLREGPVVWACEHGNGTCDCIRRGEFIDQLRGLTATTPIRKAYMMFWYGNQQTPDCY
jgi:hypothetical protein